MEDDDGIREFLVQALTDEGYGVATARDGDEALAAVRQRPPDLILLDLLLPAMDGAAFLDAYGQAPGPKAPVVVVTATRGAARALEERVQAVVHKPFSVDHLLDLVRTHVGPD